MKRWWLIVGLIIFIAVPIIVFIIFNSSQNQSGGKITEKIDPITGDVIVNADTNPETDNKKDSPIFYGMQNVAPFLGDNAAVTTLQYRLGIYFKDAKKIKISKDSIKRSVDTNSTTGVTTIQVQFLVYLDENINDSYKTIINFNNTKGVLTTKISDLSGRVTVFTDSAYSVVNHD